MKQLLGFSVRHISLSENHWRRILKSMLPLKMVRASCQLLSALSAYPPQKQKNSQLHLASRITHKELLSHIQDLLQLISMTY